MAVNRASAVLPAARDWRGASRRGVAGLVAAFGLLPVLPAWAQDTIAAARFSITIDGYEVSGFTEGRVKLTDASTGNDASSRRRVIGTVLLRAPLTMNGKPKWGDIVVKLRGAAAPVVTITAATLEGQVIARWQAIGGKVVDVTVSNLQSEGNAVAMEEITIVHEGLAFVAR